MFLKDLVTEKDGVSFCPVRIAYIIGFVICIVLTLHDAFSIDKFSFMEHSKDWLSGLGEYLGLGGAAVGGKAFTEKDS